MNRTALLAMLALSACGGTSLSSYCKRSTQILCKKLFQCSPQVATAQGYSNESDCVTKLQASQCAAFESTSCPALDLAPYEKCLAESEALACTATEQPASCKDLPNPDLSKCSSSDGRVSCTSRGSSVSNTSCSRSNESCTDGKSYVLSCSQGTCTCAVSGVTGKTFAGTSCELATAQLNSACGWNLR